MNKLLRPLPFLLALTLLCILTALLLPITEKAIILASVIFSAYLLATLIHESGHLLAGAWAGLKPKEMIVGPFRIAFTGRSIVLRSNDSWLCFGGTMRFAAPSSNLEEVARKWSWMALGGPAGNLLTALLILLLAPTPYLWAECLLWISFGLAAATLFPLSNGVSHSDGRLFLILYKKSARASLLIAGVILQKDYLSERRPAEWNPRITDTAARLLCDLPERTLEQLAEESELRMFLYYHFADKEQPKEAVEYIQPVSLTKHPSAATPLSRIMIDSLYAVHLLTHSPCSTESRQEAEALVKGLSDREPYSYHKAWAALLSTQGQTEEAARHLTQAQILLHRWFRPFGTYHFELASLSQIQDRLDKASKAAKN